MNRKDIDYTLYLCTDRGCLMGRDLNHAVEQAIAGGCTVVQLREKNIETSEFYQIAKEVKQVTDRYQVPLLINDRLDIVLAVDADGVHLGQTDLPAAIARQILGPDKIIGVTAKSVEQAQKAYADGADYLGVGAVYPSPTKPDAKAITLAGLREIVRSVSIPVVAIGGITKEKIAELKPCGIAGVAVISAILGGEDPKKNAEEILQIWQLGGKEG